MGDTIEHGGETWIRLAWYEQRGEELALAEEREEEARGYARDMEQAANEARAERDKALRALESLTPNGSEFVGDVERCIAHVRECRVHDHELIKRFKAERDALAEQLEALSRDRIDLKAKLRDSEADLGEARRQLAGDRVLIGALRTLRDALKAQAVAQAEWLEKATKERNIFRDELVGSEAELAAAEKRIAALKKALYFIHDPELALLDKVGFDRWFAAGEPDDPIDALYTILHASWRYSRKAAEALGTEALAALDQKPKPEPPEYVAGPPPSAFPGW